MPLTSCSIDVDARDETDDAEGVLEATSPGLRQSFVAADLRVQLRRSVVPASARTVQPVISAISASATNASAQKNAA